MFFDFYGSIWYCLTRAPPSEKKVLRNAENGKKSQQNTAENVIEKKRSYKYV